jgi:hypothetical protein
VGPTLVQDEGDRPQEGVVAHRPVVPLESGSTIRT